MDRKLSKSQEIQRLIRLSEASRGFLSNEAMSLTQRFDVPARLRQSLIKHPSGWVLGSLASGLFASTIFRRKPKPKEKSRGLPLTLLGLILTAARPLVKIWLTGQAKNYLTGQLHSFSSGRPATPRPQSPNPS